MTETFVRRFQSGLTATMTVEVEDGRLVDWRCAWSRKLTRKRLMRIIREYRIWRDDSLLQVANKYGFTTTLVVEV